MTFRTSALSAVGAVCWSVLAVPLAAAQQPGTAVDVAETAAPVLTLPAAAAVATAATDSSDFDDAGVLWEDQPGTEWLDRTRAGFQDWVTRSARKLDGLSGVRYPEARYERVSGSVSVSTEWTEFDGFNPRVRFRLDVPLPGMDDRFNAFVGRFDRDDVVTGQGRNRGARPLARSSDRADQTIAGLSFRQQGDRNGRFDGGAGVRLRFPLDPYVRAGWRYERGEIERLRLSLRETAFWQNSEGAGFTSRIDLERGWDSQWLARWSTSGTISQKSEGVRAYTVLQALRLLPRRRALALEASIDGESDAEVPLAQYGVRGAYRFGALREWLIFEISGGVNWPRELRSQERETSWGLGLGVQMLMGDAPFTPEPVTF